MVSTDHSRRCPGCTHSMIKDAMVSTANRMFQKPLPGRLSFLTHLMPCSLPAAIREPENVTEPIMMPKPAVISTTMDGVPSEVRISFKATSAAAPPPTVLNTDTSCGMSVILTFLAETTPATAPMMMPAINSTTATPCWKPLEISPANSTMNAMTTARIMPMAETILPLRAVFGEFIRCRPITNITAASR